MKKIVKLLLLLFNFFSSGEESAQDITAIRILSPSEQSPVMGEIVVVDGSIKHEKNHLWNFVN